MYLQNGKHVDNIGKHAYIWFMTKNDAIGLFGTVKYLADALGVTRHAIYQWPDELTQDQEDRVVGAGVRLGKLPETGKPEEAAT